MNNILYVTSDTKNARNSSVWRCEWPMAAIEKTGVGKADLIDIDQFAAQNDLTTRLCRWADVIVIQTNLYGETLKAVAFWRAQGKCVVLDVDDALDKMPRNNPSWGFWYHGLVSDPQATDKFSRLPGRPPIEELLEGLKLVSAVTTPSKLLAKEWARYAPCYYLPNFINSELYQTPPKRPGDEIIIGGGWSAAHLQSFANPHLLSGLAYVCKHRPQVKIMICSGDKRLYNMIPVPEERKIYRPWVEFEQWPAQLAQIDIGIVPTNGELDAYRSDAKPLELARMGKPFVYNDCRAYDDLPHHVGRLVGSEAWGDGLIAAVDDLSSEGTQMNIEDGRAWADERDVNANAQAILSLYQKIYYGEPQ